MRGTRVETGVLNEIAARGGTADALSQTSNSVRWEVADNANFTRAVVPASTRTESSQTAVVAAKPIWLRARYWPSTCGKPRVTTTGAYRWDPAVSSDQCPDTELFPGEPMTLIAGHADGQTQPVWTVEGPAEVRAPAARQTSTSTSYVGPELSYVERRRDFFARITLSFCAPLDVAVQPVWSDGKPMSASDLAMIDAAGWDEYADPLALLTDDGGCPAELMGLAGSSQHVGYRKAENRWVRVGATLNGKPVRDDQNPVLRVGADGVTTDKARFLLSPLCFPLVRGDRVELDTAPNCPGHEGEEWYLAGTVVNLHFKDAKDKDFESWEGADATDGEAAAVVMNEKRTIVAHWDNLSVWEQAGNFFSSLTQRALAALTTAAMALAGKLLLVGTVSSLVLGGLAQGLEAVGAGGAVADGLHQGSRAINNTVTLVNEVTNCMSLWASGGSSSLIPAAATTWTGRTGSAATAAGATGTSSLAPIAGAARQVINVMNVVNAFGSGTDAYFEDAHDAWSSIGDIGDCLQPYADAVSSS